MSVLGLKSLESLLVTTDTYRYLLVLYTGLYRVCLVSGILHLEGGLLGS
jgi:hypothetical protein